MSHWREPWLWLVVASLILANFFVWRAVGAGVTPPLKVAFLNIGQGDAIYIEAPNGNQVLLDGGRGRGVLAALGEVMPFSDLSLDLVIASHPDADHIGGLVDVFERYEVGGFLDPGLPAATQVYEKLLASVAAEGSTRAVARRGLRVNLDAERGVVLQILFPDLVPAGWETNEASIIAKLTYGEADFLLTGDAPQTIERYLVSLDGDFLSSEVLKLGHHGSKTSSGEEFLEAVQPAYGVVSVGKNNYGHPSPEVLDRLEKEKIPYLRTDEEGTIIFETNGQEITWHSV